MRITIDVYHHFDGAPCRCHSCAALATEVRALDADLREFMTRKEVPQEIADALGEVRDNLDNNFLTTTE